MGTFLDDEALGLLREAIKDGVVQIARLLFVY